MGRTEAGWPVRETKRTQDVVRNQGLSNLGWGILVPIEGAAISLGLEMMNDAGINR